MGLIGSILWASYFGEATYIIEYTENYIYPADRKLIRDRIHEAHTYDMDALGKDLGAMLLIGVILRLIAMFSMTVSNRQKQK